jgi:hypothetical protein
MKPKLPDATCDYEPSPAPGERGAPRPVAFAPASATPAAELQDLLRKRLRFAAFLFAGLYGVPLAGVLLEWFTSGRSFWERPSTLIAAAGLALVVFVAVFLAWRLGRVAFHSVVRLRAFEAMLFGSVLVFKLYVDLMLSSQYSSPILSQARDWWQNGQQDLAGTTYIGLVAGSLLYWVLFILAYGVLIPNPGKRCAAAVGTVALLTMLSLSGYGLWNEIPTVPWLVSFHLYPLTVLAATAALAIYASHRIE